MGESEVACLSNVTIAMIALVLQILLEISDDSSRVALGHALDVLSPSSEFKYWQMARP